MPVELKIRFCQDIAKGMEYLHNNDIIHRDLKTDNVLVVSKNPRDPVTAKVSDFGTSQSYIESSIKVGLQHIGTPVHMAPEIILEKDSGVEPVTLKSDVYSFSICMYEVWKGSDPYDPAKFPDGESIFKFVCNGKRLEIPQDCIFKDIIEKTWNQKPSDRISFNEVIILLDGIYKSVAKNESSEKNSERKASRNSESVDADKKESEDSESSKPTESKTIESADVKSNPGSQQSEQSTKSGELATSSYTTSSTSSATSSSMSDSEESE